MHLLIIVAGGSGKRMRLKFNKIFFKINKKPVLYWTLTQCQKSQTIDEIIVSTRDVDIEAVRSLVDAFAFTKVKEVVSAGNSRQESTHKILEQLKDRLNETDVVGVHNAVNPFVSEEELEKVFTEAELNKAALLAQPAHDTVKFTDGNGKVSYTLPRAQTWYAQTPQAAQFRYLLAAFRKANEDGFLGTDDTQLLERIGVKAKIVPCSPYNIKFTFPQDRCVARSIIKHFL